MVYHSIKSKMMVWRWLDEGFGLETKFLDPETGRLGADPENRSDAASGRSCRAKPIHFNFNTGLFRRISILFLRTLPQSYRLPLRLH